MGVYRSGEGTEPGILRQHRPPARRSCRLCESDITDFLGNSKKGPNSGHALYAGDGAGGGHGKGRGHGNGKVGRRGKHGRGRKGTNDVGGGSAAAAGGDGSSAKATDGSTPVRGCYRCDKESHVRTNCTEKLYSRCNERGHTADVCPTSEEEAVLAMTGEVGARLNVGEDDTVKASAF